MFSVFYYNLIKWIFIALDVFLAGFFVYMLFKTKCFWENPRLFYPWEKKKLLEESREKSQEEEIRSDK